LNCFWCHNPEGRHAHPEVQFFAARCITCGACVLACPNAAHEIRDNVHIFHRDRCQTVGACVETCYADALVMTGQVMSVEEVMEEVLRDRVFYDSSGGGVTLSGGEPSLSGSFAREILEQCKAQSVHTAIETCGECPWPFLEELLPVTDLVMMDIKHLSGERHRAVTGKSNERILDNARRLAMTNMPLIFRTPVVPTVNDFPETIGEIASFVRELIDLRTNKGVGMNGEAHITYELLAFHRLAADKYRSLGRGYDASGINPPPRDQMERLADVATRCGVETKIR
jgi:pyruvate formate lyase activating enzyme